MDEILSLLKTADGPSRVIDGAIAKHLGWTHIKMKGDSRPYWRLPGRTQGWDREEQGPPRYTESIDAAISLIPAGLYWMAAFGKCRDDETIGACQICERGSNGYPIMAEAEGHSVNIAICIAALRAMTPKTAVGRSE